MIVIIDNYDSFVHNLARYFALLGQCVQVIRNDRTDAAAIRALSPQAVVLSPGPCDPLQAGCSIDVVRELFRDLPILGVCLGHQAIAAAFGGVVVRSDCPVHGRASLIHHCGQGVFAGLPNPIRAGRYHSLVVDRRSLPPELVQTAWMADDTLMALAHRDRPTVGIQFHPESVLTERGFDLLANFLRMAGVAVPDPVPDLAAEMRVSVGRADNSRADCGRSPSDSERNIHTDMS